MLSRQNWKQREQKLLLSNFSSMQQKTGQWPVFCCMSLFENEFDFSEYPRVEYLEIERFDPRVICHIDR